MRRILCLILFLINFSSCVLPVGASDIKDEGRPADINVEIGKVTEVTFSDKVIKVIKGGKPDSVLVEVLDASVYLLPKTSVLPDIFVTTASGSSYPLSLHISKDRDIKIQIGSSKYKSSNVYKSVYSDVMDLMRDLMLQREPVMATVLPQVGQVLLANKEIQLTVDKAYELGDWRAYILTANNLINSAVIIPVEQISLPNLLAISTDQDMLFAHGQQGDSTKVYMITGN